MPAYLEPVGDLDVDLVDSLHAVVECLHGLAGLQVGLLTVSQSARPMRRLGRACRGGEGATHQHAGVFGPRHVLHGGGRWEECVLVGAASSVCVREGEVREERARSAGASSEVWRCLK